MGGTAHRRPTFYDRREPSGPNRQYPYLSRFRLCVCSTLHLSRGAEPGESAGRPVAYNDSGWLREKFEKGEIGGLTDGAARIPEDPTPSNLGVGRF